VVLKEFIIVEIRNKANSYYTGNNVPKTTHIRSVFFATIFYVTPDHGQPLFPSSQQATGKSKLTCVSLSSAIFVFDQAIKYYSLFDMELLIDCFTER